MQEVRPEDVPLAVKYIKRFANNVPGMTPLQIESIEPGVRRLIEQASELAVAYRGADGKPLPNVKFDTTLEAIQSAAAAVDRNIARRLGTAVSGESPEIAEIKTMAQKLVDDMNAQATKSGAPKLAEKDLPDAYDMSESLIRIREQNEEVYGLFTNAQAIRSQISTAGVRSLGRAKSAEELNSRWFSLPEGLRQRIMAQEKANKPSPIAEKGREMRARFGTPAAPPAVPAAPAAPTGGGASPLARRPQQPPGRPGRSRPQQPPPPEGPDGGRPRREMPPPPDFPMG
jgi:hypothetical protein